jgi:cell division protein DivIC
MLRKTLDFITNKYFLATAFFLSWIFIFASNNILSQYKENKELQEMKAKVYFLETEIAAMQQQSEALKNDPKAIEKFAREKYHMKKANEDLFIYDTVVTKNKISK